MSMANYKTSKDYDKLWELAQHKNIVCICADHSHKKCFPNVCVTWSIGLVVKVSVGDNNYVAEKSKDAFIEKCEACNLEWLIPAEAKTNHKSQPVKRVVGSGVYPIWEDYEGGGSILTKYTTLENVISECKVHDISYEEISKLIKDNNDVIILSGEIKAVRKSGT